ncbi:hypothetical protein A4A49_38821 [Nicotiana attenuata]|uniref:Uncharacterized protein n=1 Tax=Nicotiana attenuata TaxID=49451 RepID=A0A1J6KP01_NICAT|nr:hypothetical protein A4A49_38821 [Nicotiana attenuata]
MPPAEELNGENEGGGEDYGYQYSETEEQFDIGNQELNNEEEEVLSSEIENLYFSPTSSPISSPPHPQLFNQLILEKGKRFCSVSEVLYELKSLNSKTEEENGNQECMEEEEKEELKGKRTMSELYELKPIVPKFSNLEEGGPSNYEDYLNDDDYDYDQDLAILKSLYHYYFNHGVIPHPSSEELIHYIQASIPNLKIRGQGLVNKILMLERNFLTLWKMAGYYYPEITHPVYAEIFHLSMGLWGNYEDYYILTGCSWRL